MKAVLATVVLLSLGIVACGSGNEGSSDCIPPWWDTDWLYRKQISVTAGATTVPAGYSIRVSVDRDTLQAARKALPDYRDIRILHWDGATWRDLDRIIQTSLSEQNGGPYWFATQAAIPASTTDKDYYVYYGNTEAGDAPADPVNVYVLWDDFEGVNELEKWDTYTSVPDPPYWTIEEAPDFPERIREGKALRGKAVDMAENQWIIAKNVDESDLLFSAFWYLRDANSDISQGFRTKTTPEFSHLGASFCCDGELHISQTPYCSHATVDSPLFTDLTWTKVTIVVVGSQMKVLVNDDKVIPEGEPEWQDLTDSPCDPGTLPLHGSLGFRAWRVDYGDTVYFDDVLMRRYVDPEPTATCGAEQAADCSGP